MTYETVPLDGIAKTTVEGTLDLEVSTELLLSVARDATIAGRTLLIDLREAQSPYLTFADVYRLVRMLEHHQDAFCGRIALLDRYRDSFEKTQFFEASSGYVGLDVRAFLDEAAAIDWLESAPC